MIEVNHILDISKYKNNIKFIKRSIDDYINRVFYGSHEDWIDTLDKHSSILSNDSVFKERYNVERVKIFIDPMVIYQYRLDYHILFKEINGKSYHLKSHTIILPF